MVMPMSGIKAQIKTNVPRHEEYLLVKRLRPPSRWLKLNVDGARSDQQGRISAGPAGSVVKDHNGSWIMGIGKEIDAGLSHLSCS